MSLNKPGPADWHTHSTASDGELSPVELVQSVKASGLDCFALTDHDTVDGVGQAINTAQELGVGLVAGVEVSSCWSNQDIHIVGLAVDTSHSGLLGNLKQQMQRRQERACHIGLRLEKLGVQGMYDAASALASNGVPSRPHFAQALVDAEVCRDKKQAFHRYLAVSKPAYVKTQWPSLAEVVGWIRAAGGMPVLAHPGRYKLTRTKLDRLVSSFAEAGGGAMEVAVSNHTTDMVQYLAGLAQKYGLYASQGSDYHGLSMEWVKLGRFPPLPSRCRPVSEWMTPSMYLSSCK